jgi:hypothetical protein
MRRSGSNVNIIAVVIVPHRSRFVYFPTLFAWAPRTDRSVRLQHPWKSGANVKMSPSIYRPLVFSEQLRRKRGHRAGS